MIAMPMDISAGILPAEILDIGITHVFPFSSSTLLKVTKGDITKWSIDGHSDAIVNSTNELMRPGGGSDLAIHRAAGPQLREICSSFPEIRPGVRCSTGEARITPGFKLPASRVIHTVGPIYFAHQNPTASLQNAYRGFKLPASHVIHTVGPMYFFDRNPAVSLRSAYRSSLALAKANKIQYVAFPAICCGVYGYPLAEAATVAISTVKEFGDDFKEVHFVLFLEEVFNVWLEKAYELLLN